MSHADYWYVRFPDGRILRAASTALLRQELDAGHIPLGSTVRRSPTDEWVSLQWMEEFADLAEQRSASPSEPDASRRRSPARRSPANASPHVPATVGSRLDSSRLYLVGIRAYLEELLTALDSTLVPRKLLLGCVAGLLVGGLLALDRASGFEADSPWFVPACCLAAISLLLLAFLTALLTQLTYVELSRLRPARWEEGVSGIGWLMVRLLLLQLLVCGSAWGLIVLLRWLPHWLGPGPEEPWTIGRQIAAGNALVIGMILEVLAWPVLFFWWLAPPLLAVEDCSVWRGLRQWFALLRRHLGRVLLYQALALGLGVLAAGPFLLLLVPLYWPTFYPPEELSEVVEAARRVLLGLACAPVLTYWIVANMFIYLNLRYGGGRHRE